MSNWIIETEGDGTISIVRDGRRLRSGLTPEEARRFLTRRRKRSDRVLQQDPDGYRHR